MMMLLLLFLFRKFTFFSVSFNSNHNNKQKKELSEESFGTILAALAEIESYETVAFIVGIVMDKGTFFDQLIINNGLL